MNFVFVLHSSNSYVVSNLFYALLQFSNLPLESWCSTRALRATNLLFFILQIFVIRELLNIIHGKKSRNGIDAITISLFPVGFFFHFLYYTDPGSTTLILLSYLFSLRDWNWMSSSVLLVE